MTARPVTDHLPVSLRAFAGPQFVTFDDPDQTSAKPKRLPSPASTWTLILDCETTTHPGQALRFGTYQFRNGDELDESGIFYDPDGVTAAELTVLRNHATMNGLVLRTRQSFVDDVFFAALTSFAPPSSDSICRSTFRGWRYAMLQHERRSMALPMRCMAVSRSNYQSKKSVLM